MTTSPAPARHAEPEQLICPGCTVRARPTRALIGESSRVGPAWSRRGLRFAGSAWWRWLSAAVHQAAPRRFDVRSGDGVPVGPIERYLAYLTDVNRSPNTIKVYAQVSSAATR